jgi:DNA-binding response OmpR family regulator
LCLSAAKLGSPGRSRVEAAALDRVLIVDDDADLLSGLAFLLGAHYEIDVATNGEQALEILRRQRVDVVVLDMLMPRLDGQGVLREIRAWDSALPVIAVSARPDLLARSREIGADEALGKPFGIVELERKIETLIEKSRTREQPRSG